MTMTISRVNDNNDNDCYTWLKKERCTFCQEFREVKEVEAYYNQGRKKKIIYLCCLDMLRKNADPCYDRYIKDLGIGHVVVAGYGGWYDETYKIIRSFFISSPCRYSVLWNNDTHNNNKRKLISGGVGNMAFEDAVMIAYKISPTVREYLNAVDKSKVPNPTSINNPRLWPIIRTMLYNDKLLVTVDKDKLIFKWSQIMI